MAQKNPFGKVRAGVSDEAQRGFTAGEPVSATPSHQDNIPFTDVIKRDPLVRTKGKKETLNYNNWLLRGK